MSLSQSLYYMSLVGSLAGLAAWTLSSLFAYFWRFPAAVPDMIPAVLLGGFMGALSVFFGDYWSGNRVLARWVLSGAGVGCLAGVIGTLVEIPIRNSLVVRHPMLVRVLAWMIVGLFIGLGLGLRRAGVNRARIGHPVTGGLAGGLVGGVLFTVAGSSYPDVTNVLCFMLTGVGISCGITLAPVLLSQAVLQFVSSGDARAQSKYGRSRKQWELQEGDYYVVGSQNAPVNLTRYRREVEVLIPDAGIAARHATLFAKEGRYFIARHDDVRSAGALARYPLKVSGRSVSSAQQLQHLDEILIGSTSLKFHLRSKESS